MREALNAIGDLKAPGPNDMPSIFYKKLWDTVGDQLVKEVLQVLNGGPIPAGCNDTTVFFIPKVQKPELVKDLRSISPCNVIYKLVSKSAN